MFPARMACQKRMDCERGLSCVYARRDTKLPPGSWFVPHLVCCQVLAAQDVGSVHHRLACESFEQRDLVLRLRAAVACPGEWNMPELMAAALARIEELEGER